MISEIIEKWIKGILIDGITGNLSGLFDNVNAKVGEIASDVGSTPQAWNSGIFNMLRSLSETVVLPIAAAILALVIREKDGVKLSATFLYQTGTASDDNMVVYICDQASKIGIELTPQSAQMMDWYAMIQSGDYALSVLLKDKTVMVIAHRMRTVANADKIVVLDDGKVSEMGTPAELMKKGGLYAHLVELQQGK